MYEILKDYLALHGYWVLFIWTFLEGEAGLILAGFLAYQGYMNISGVMLTACLGAFCGDQFYFYIGRWQGMRLLHIFSFIARKFRKALRMMEKYGSYVAFVSRYTYGFRIVLPVILGMTTFPGGRFCLLNLLSASLWSIVFSLTGYLFGKGASLLVEDVSRYEHHLMAVLAGLIAVFWLSHILRGLWKQRPARRRLKIMKSKGFLLRQNGKDQSGLR